MTFTVKIPNIETNEIIEHKFSNVLEIAKFLGIAKNTVYSILNNTCAFNRNCTMKLKGVSIIKDENKILNDITINDIKDDSIENKRLKARFEIKRIKEELRLMELQEKELKAKKLNKEFIASLKSI